MDFPIFKNIIDTMKGKDGNTIGSTKCPAHDELDHISDNYYKYKIDNASKPPNCSETFFSSTDNDGCCTNQESTSTPEIDTCPENKSTNIRLVHFDGTTDISYIICHKEEIGTLTSIFDNPNKIAKFFVILAIMIIFLLAISIIGCCYEFWLRYGDSTDCLYYISKCNNAKYPDGEKDNKLSLIQYLFPSSICSYPYQKCIPSNSQKGGNKLVGGSDEKVGFHSTSIEYKSVNGIKAKCITIHDDTGPGSNNRPFPYSVADFAQNDISFETIKLILKAFSWFFLVPVLATRKVLSWFLTKLSRKYQKNIRNNPITSNFLYLIFTGLFFSIVGIIGVNSASMGVNGPFWILELIMSGLNLTTLNSPIMMVISLILGIFQWKLLKKYYANCDSDENLVDYYQLFRSKLFYIPSAFDPEKENKLRTKIFAILKDIGMLFFVLPIIFMLTMIFALLGSLFAQFYMTISLIFNFFYIPLSNSLEFMELLQSHADLITILFCIGVIGAAKESLDPKVTGVMAGILVIIILFKVIKAGKKTV